MTEQEKRISMMLCTLVDVCANGRDPSYEVIKIWAAALDNIGAKPNELTEAMNRIAIGERADGTTIPFYPALSEFVDMVKLVRSENEKRARQAFLKSCTVEIERGGYRFLVHPEQVRPGDKTLSDPSQKALPMTDEQRRDMARRYSVPTLETLVRVIEGNDGDAEIERQVLAEKTGETVTIDCYECQATGWYYDRACPLCDGSGVCSVQNAREGSTQNEAEQ